MGTGYIHSLTKPKYFYNKHRWFRKAIDVVIFKACGGAENFGKNIIQNIAAIPFYSRILQP